MREFKPGRLKPTEGGYTGLYEMERARYYQGRKAFEEGKSSTVDEASETAYGLLGWLDAFADKLDRVVHRNPIIT